MNWFRGMTSCGCALVACLLGSNAIGQQQPSPVQPGSADAIWSLAATGDSIITRRIVAYESDPAFMKLIRLIREADAAFTNLELSVFRLREFKGYPQAESGGSWLLGSPEVLGDLKWAGFDLFNRANNHTTDYGVEGMMETDRILDSLGLVHAGSGMTLGEASQPQYLETSKGRIALIGLATTFTPMSRASDARPETKGRPGLNALRVERTYQLDAERMAELRRLVTATGGRLPEKEDAAVRFLGNTFLLGRETKVIEKANAIDEDRILRSIRHAARQADFVIVTSHSHEPSNEALEPPAFLVEFIKKCVDAGADTYIVHGPHQLRGIEVYKGKPIFYSLGNFIFENETNDYMPSDIYESFGLGNTAMAADLNDTRFKGGTVGFPSNPVWFESVVAVPIFRGHRITELKLYPIDLGHKLPRSQRGVPRLADADLGRKIIERVARLSAAFGTRIVFQNGIGVWQSSISNNAAQHAH
jgi:poly-gamma-glutamate synthesis protein (capsule biosynthesis protein)